ncbi:phospholipase D-like domain-containing protein [Mycobacterium sp.]|uniref:phospholipase D-like domain-containing protein n=1 Tax=Mycobacterium sp. TaxID=1785 RepID=UPI002D08BBCC|nr:phospholipase D-like domain-containing protein [Mycobacterium sp.]HTY32333.1 phospholipase D-like domain-containing protein [Mycobacterium sp.]
MRDDRLLITGQTCWRVERADQLGYTIDAADYFRHVKAAMLRAKHRIMLVGWDFDTRAAFERGGQKLAGPNQLGAFLYWLLWRRPTLEIHVLKSNLRLLPVFDGIWYGITPVSVVNRLSSRRLHLAIDGARPTGSVHHQKIVIVDDVLAFCGGIDLTLDRWDTPEHKHDNRFRRALGRRYGPRHEVATAVDGAAAAALAEVARDRWQSATDQSLDPVNGAHTVWPSGLRPSLRGIDVGIARTLPTLDDRAEVREVEALNLAAIAAARRTVYLENQYLAARSVVEALAARLRERDGPEVVIVIPRRGLNRLERETMDGARHRLIQDLWAADDHRRLGVYWPETDGGSSIYVHSKVLIVDDRLLRIGSSNFNNRSLGFDSECDLAVEADPNAEAHQHIRRAIESVRHQLVYEHLDVPTGEFERTMRQGKSFLEAVETLRGQGKTLRRFTSRAVANEDSPLAENELMDPDHVPRSLTRSMRRLIARLSP